jgi:hypothetical protein
LDWQGFLLCWYSVFRQPTTEADRKTTVEVMQKADSNYLAGTEDDCSKKIRTYSSASIENHYVIGCASVSNMIRGQL